MSGPLIGSSHSTSPALIEGPSASRSAVRARPSLPGAIASTRTAPRTSRGTHGSDEATPRAISTLGSVPRNPSVVPGLQSASQGMSSSWLLFASSGRTERCWLQGVWES
jgi:hypothetical protein